LGGLFSEQEPKTVFFHQCVRNRLLSPYLLKEGQVWGEESLL